MLNWKAYKPIPENAQYIEDELIVKYKKGYNPLENVSDNLNQELKKLGLIYQEKVYKETESPVLKRYYLLKFKQGSDIKSIHKTIFNFKEIETTEPNYIFKISENPNDPYYQSDMWGLKKIDMEHAWDISKGSKNITVAVIDTGINYNHPDLPRDIIKGRNFINGTNDPMDDYGHGTHVAGTIGALTNNSAGVSGVNWDVGLMAIKVLGANGSGPSTAILQGIEYAANNGVKVINMSLGDPANSCNTSYQDVIDDAISKGVIVVVAAGNETQDARNTSPASCNGVITVGASTPSDSRANFSNFGPRVDIAAPGTGIMSTMGGGYRPADGTSMASPHVAGVVALLLSACPGVSNQNIRSLLRDNGDVMADTSISGRRLNAYKALLACNGSSPIPTNTPAPTNNPVPTNTPVSTAVPTSTTRTTPTLTPVPTSTRPTSRPTSPLNSQPTIVPTPYDCIPEPTCIANARGKIQLCPLICYPR